MDAQARQRGGEKGAVYWGAQHPGWKDCLGNRLTLAGIRRDGTLEQPRKVAKGICRLLKMGASGNGINNPPQSSGGLGEKKKSFPQPNVGETQERSREERERNIWTDTGFSVSKRALELGGRRSYISQPRH